MGTISQELSRAESPLMLLSAPQTLFLEVANPSFLQCPGGGLLHFCRARPPVGPDPGRFAAGSSQVWRVPLTRVTPRTEAALSLRSVGARRGGSAAASSGPAPGPGRNKEALSSLRPGFVAGWTGVRSCCGAGNAIYYCLFCRGWDFRAFAGPPGSPAEPAGAVCLSAPLCPSLLIFPGVSPCSFNSLHPIPCFSAALPSIFPQLEPGMGTGDGADGAATSQVPAAEVSSAERAAGKEPCLGLGISPRCPLSKLPLEGCSPHPGPWWGPWGPRWWHRFSPAGAEPPRCTGKG